jgi:hypothetical protein
MESILFLVMIVILFDLAASRWGVDSREDVNGREWQRQAAWGSR